MYNSPYTKQAELHAAMDDILRGNNSGHIIILGDFNTDVSVKTNVTFCNYLKVRHNCDQLVTGCTTKYQTTIALVFQTTNIKRFPQLTLTDLIITWCIHLLIIVTSSNNFWVISFQSGLVVYKYKTNILGDCKAQCKWFNIIV